MLSPLVWVNLAEMVDHGEAKAFPDSVVICEAIVTASHDVQGSKIPPAKVKNIDDLVLIL